MISSVTHFQRIRMPGALSKPKVMWDIIKSFFPPNVIAVSTSNFVVTQTKNKDGLLDAGNINKCKNCYYLGLLIVPWVAFIITHMYWFSLYM